MTLFHIVCRVSRNWDCMIKAKRTFKVGASDELLRRNLDLSWAETPIDPRHLLKWFFSDHFKHHWFQWQIQKSDHVKTNTSWLQFAAQLLQISKKYQLWGRSYPCDVFCICQTLLCHILNCILLENAKLNKFATKLWSTFPNGKKDSLISLIA